MFKQEFNFDLELLKGIQSYLPLIDGRTFYLMKKSAEVLRKPLLGDPKPSSEYKIPSFFGDILLPEIFRLSHILHCKKG
jgi:hypothetical protein